jgi:hypothetical protein
VTAFSSITAILLIEFLHFFNLQNMDSDGEMRMHQFMDEEAIATTDEEETLSSCCSSSITSG